jgi:integrase
MAMASLELQNETYRIVFLHSGRKRSYSLKTGSEKDAERMKGSVEDILFRIAQGYMSVPRGVDVVAFLKNGGKPPAAEETLADDISLQKLRDRYIDTHSNGALEPNTLLTIKIHLGHLIETLGARFAVSKLTQPDLQRHIDRRGRAKGLRGKKLSPATLRKEITSFRAVWNWAKNAKLVAGDYPNAGLVFPKSDEKPPFATYDEIETRIARGGLSKAEIRQMWDCLFLTLPEIAQFLDHIQRKARMPWLYPMVCTAAHTGARRSELLRIGIHDVDVNAGTILLHEKKREKQKRTTRRVPLSPSLLEVLKTWIAEHPGGPTLFCQAMDVERSKTRRQAPTPVTRDEAHDHFQRVLAESKWDKLRGWHVLRHSFASNCAAKAVDQRLIDEWMGHQTEEMRKRYRHLMPSTQQAAIRAVFG